MALRDVIGQEKAVNILLRTIQRGRIPSAYLFAGESGIGKKFTALNLAKALNCLKPVTTNELQVTSETQTPNSNPPLPTDNPPLPPLAKGGGGGFDSESIPSLALPPRGGELEWGGDCCDECSSCKKIDSRVHPDLLIISPEGGQIKIDEIRAIDETLSLKSFEGKWKVVVVEEASTMNLYAANAFLKTLEEPPRDSLVILVSSNPERLPDTIRSRCSRVNFTTLSYEACKKVISQQSTVNNQKTGGPSSLQADKLKRLSILARLSMGRPGLAVSADLLDEREWFLKLLQEMIKAEKDGWTSKEEMEKWLELIVILFRDMVITKITKDRKNLINIDLKDYITEFSSTMDLKVIIDCYKKLNTLRGYLNFNLNRSLTWNYIGSLLRMLKPIKM